VDKKARYRIIVIVSISILFIILAGFWIRFKTAPEAVKEPVPIPVSAVRPELHDLRNKITISAVLETERMVMVIPKVSGTILEIPVEEGDEVSKGEVLARIDSEPYLLELNAAESAWRLAESSLSRLNGMKGSSGVSLQQLDEAETSRDAAFSSYELARMRYSYAEIKAPVSGLLLKRYSDAGNLASSEHPLFLLGDNGDLRVKVQIPEKYWESFTEPEKIRVLVSYPAGGDETIRDFEILRISPSISPENKTFEVICSMDSEPNIWPIGAGVNVELVLNEREQIWSLPLRSISVEGELWEINPDSNRVSRVYLHDFFQDKVRFAIPDELSRGLFVLDGQHRLREGQLVTAFETDA